MKQNGPGQWRSGPFCAHPFDQPFARWPTRANVGEQRLRQRGLWRGPRAEIERHVGQRVGATVRDGLTLVLQGPTISFGRSEDGSFDERQDVDRESDGFLDPGTTVADPDGHHQLIRLLSTSALTEHGIDFVARLALAETTGDIADAMRRIITDAAGAARATIAVVECGAVRFIESADSESADLASAEPGDSSRLTVADDDPISACIRTGEARLFSDLTELETASTHRQSVIAAGDHAYAVVPIAANGVTLGAVAASWRHLTAVDDATISMLSSLASLAGQTLARVQRVEDDHALADIVGELSRSADFDDVNRVIAVSAATVLGATSVEVGVVSGGMVLRPTVVGPDEPELRRWYRAALNETVPATDALRRDEAVVLSDEATWERYPNLAATRHALDVGTFVVEPLRTRQMQGVLALSFCAIGAYDRRCRSFVDRLVDIASEALDRADLLEREREAQRRSRIVRALTESLPNCGSLHEAAASAAAEIRGLERAVSVSLAWGQPDETDRVEIVEINPPHAARTATTLDNENELRHVATGLHDRAGQVFREHGAGEADPQLLPWFELPRRADETTTIFQWGFDLGQFVMVIQIEWHDPAFELDADRRTSMVADLRTAGRSLHRISLQTTVDRRRRRMAQLMTGTVTGWWIWEIDTDTVRWSPGVAEMLGTQGDAASLDASVQTIEPESRERLRAAIERSISDGREYELELQTVTGRWVWTKAMFSDDPSHPNVLMGLIRDVTDRKEATLALEASDRRQRNIIDALVNLIIITTPDGSIIHVNRIARRHSPGDADASDTGQPCWTLPLWNERPQSAETLRSRLMTAADTGSPQRFDIEATVDDALCVLDAQIVPVLEPSGAVDYLVISATDITRRVEYEDRLADLLDRQRTITRRLQDALLPRSLPNVAGYQLAARYEAAERDLDVGGDWYDAFRLASGAVAISIGDIVGRGLDAAGATGQLRSVTRATAETAGGPAGVVDAVDRFANGTPRALGASFLYLELDPETGRVEACRAGHMPPILIDAGGTVRLIEECGSPLLGIGSHRKRSTVSFSLEPGDTLMLFTDGLVERPERTIDVGLDQLTHAVGAEPVHQRLETFLEAVSRSMSTDEPSRDDLCMVAIRREPTEAQAQPQAQPFGSES